MTNGGLSKLRLAYKKAVDNWVEAIRTEEGLALLDHSIVTMEIWTAARMNEEDATTEAAECREAYKAALRTISYEI